jgi:hypothetical protein
MMIYSQLVIIESRDAFILLLILLLSAFAISKVAFPKVFSKLISPNKLFGFRVREDLGTNLRPFSSEHLYFTALNSMSVSFITLYLLNVVDGITLPEVLIIDHFGVAILQWLGLAFAFNLLVYIKFILISIFGLLFDMREAISRHFVDMVNASLFFFLLMLLFLGVVNFSSFIPNQHYIQAAVLLAVLFYYYRGLLIYIRLLNERAHSKLYIFSYICATELTPLTIGLVLIFNSQI